MMNGRGKSDSAVVAGKSVNKAEQSAAEPMERRATLFQFSICAAGEAAKFGRSGVEPFGVVGAARLEGGEPAAEASFGCSSKRGVRHGAVSAARTAKLMNIDGRSLYPRR
jgi:hypothetical protein